MADKLIHCIYCIENLVNGYKYIGQTRNYYARRHDHLACLRHNRHHNSYLQRAWNKYGEENFNIYIVQECEEIELDELEKYYIKKFNATDRTCGYNRESGGNKNKKASRYTKELISLHHADFSGKKNPMYGHKMPDECIHKTVTNPNYINRKHRGEDSHTCTTSKDIAYSIKKHFADGHTPRRGEVSDVAKIFGVSTNVVSHIKNGYSWGWLAV